MADEFRSHTASLVSPATSAENVVPDDQNDLAFATRGLYVGSQGSVSLVMISGDEVVLPNALPGIIYPLRVKRVKATGTTATGILGFH